MSTLTIKTPPGGSSPIVAQLCQVIADTLLQSPQTAKDAIALYRTLSARLAHALIVDLPALEAKAALGAMWLVEEMESSCAAKCCPAR